MTFSSPAFENFIMECCRLDEWDLRAMLKEKLTEADFSYQEDDYRSYRKGRYQEVHNMLAIRGEKPKVCLVAHTDVCRNHGWKQERTTEVRPTIKTINHYGKEVRIIQDQDCNIQVGGDDRLGVAINTWLALNTGYDMGLLFCTDEEIGGVSADHCSFKELLNFKLLAEVDRGNQSSDQLVVNISGTPLCSPQMTSRLLRIAEQVGKPRAPITGLLTDVLEIKRNFPQIECCNMTCGYFNSFGASAEEYIDIAKAGETLQFVSEILKDFELEKVSKMPEETNNMQHKAYIEGDILN